MKFLLRTKHWLLLLIIFSPSVIVGLSDELAFSVWTLIGSLWGMLTYLLWINAIVKYIKTNVHIKNLNIFNLTLYYLIFYIILITLMQQFDYYSLSYVQVFFHSIAFVASFYVLYYVAKNFTYWMSSQGDTSTNLISNFVCFWFFPIGIFILQPKINALT